MIDFNDTPISSDVDRQAQRDQIRSDLTSRLESVLFSMFPAGKKRRGKFLIGDVLGSPGESLEVVIEGEKAGLWTDRATGDGGDIFDLIAAHLGVDAHTDFPRVLEAAADLVGRAPSTPSRKSRKDAPVDDLGPATAKWDYVDAAGSLIAVVYRYDPPGRKKEFRPWDAKRRKMSPPDPRPLYNQPGLVGASQVVLVEGEKCAQVLIDAGIVATTAMHGANAPVEKTDWSPLAGKAVLIWPDRDKPGWEYAAQAAQAILSAGARTCHILYPPEEAAEGWDAADAIDEGFDVGTFLAHGPRLQMHDVTADDEPVASTDESVWGTEDALALAFTRRYHRDWRYVATWGRWLVWDGCRWRTEDTLAATDLIRSVCRHAALKAANPKVAAKLASASTVSGVERLARADRRHAATTEEWDADPWLLNTPGGVTDLRSGRKRAHDRADRMTKITTATSGGDCPIWLQFLDEVTGGDKELQAYLQRMVGYALTINPRARVVLPVRHRRQRQVGVRKHLGHDPGGLRDQRTDGHLHGDPHRPAPDRHGRPARRTLRRGDRDRAGSALGRVQGQESDRWRQDRRTLHASGLLRVLPAVQALRGGQPQAGDPQHRRGHEAPPAPDPFHDHGTA